MQVLKLITTTQKTIMTHSKFMNTQGIWIMAEHVNILGVKL